MPGQSFHTAIKTKSTLGFLTGSSEVPFLNQKTSTLPVWLAVADGDIGRETLSLWKVKGPCSPCAPCMSQRTSPCSPESPCAEQHFTSSTALSLHTSCPLWVCHPGMLECASVHLGLSLRDEPQVLWCHEVNLHGASQDLTLPLFQMLPSMHASRKGSSHLLLCHFWFDG